MPHGSRLWAGRAGTGIPIETERLVLRPFTPDDIDEVHAIYSEQWPRFRGPLSTSSEETRAIVEGHMAIQAEPGFSLWGRRG